MTEQRLNDDLVEMLSRASKVIKAQHDQLKQQQIEVTSPVLSLSDSEEVYEAFKGLLDRYEDLYELHFGH